MANSKYTFEQKVAFCKKYRRESGNTGIIYAEKLAEWLNENEHLDPPIKGYDFRRPNDIKDFLDKVNDEIRWRVESHSGVVRVMSTPRIDIDRIIKKCTTRGALLTELQKISKRLSDLVDTNHELASALQKEHEECEKYRQKAGSAETDLKRINKAKAAEIKKVQEALKDEKDENRRLRKINRDLLKYIKRYISDPIVHKHVSEELMKLNTDPNAKIELPESISEMIGLISLEDVFRRCSKWDEELFDDPAPADEESFDDPTSDDEDLSEDDIQETDPDDYTIMSPEEFSIRDRLNKLERRRTHES